MKYLASLALALTVAGATPVKRADPQGIDVSSYQPSVDWTTVKNNGIAFAYIKATEGTCRTDRSLTIHPGGWSGDGITLPGALDIEYNPSGAECYGLSASAMVSWVKDFSNTYEAATGRAAFGSTNPLWIARYASAIGTLPAGWEYTSFWQYADSGPNPGDADLWNGDLAGLKRMALGS
ncbi:glycoside hydrolase [Paxillus ammoniavirescens]|nr:glycoside hydrolase [Paxillus ammoniavirescens]